VDNPASPFSALAAGVEWSSASGGIDHIGVQDIAVLKHP